MVEMRFGPRMYRCVNPYCRQTYHYSMVCPGPGAADTEMLEADYWMRAKYAEMWRAGEFDLNRTPAYMRERAEKRAQARRDGPGYGWLVGVASVMLLVAAVMAALILYT